MTKNDTFFDEKFFEESNLTLIKVQNDVGLNRYATLGNIGTKIVIKTLLISTDLNFESFCYPTMV